MTQERIKEITNCIGGISSQLMTDEECNHITWRKLRMPPPSAESTVLIYIKRKQ